MLDLKTLDRFPSVRVFTGGTTNTEVVLPRKARKITITCETQKFFIAFTGTDGGTPEANKMPMPSGSYISIDLAKGYNRSNSIYLATATAGADISLMFEE